MTTHRPDDHAPDTEPLPDTLRWQLRALRRDEPPAAELWPGIAARLQPVAAAQAAVPARRNHARRRTAWYATAAAAVLAVAVGWQLRPVAAPVADVAPRTMATASVDMPLLLRQADAMAREYDAARREIEASRPAARQAAARAPAALAELDRSAAEVRAALARDPDAHFLLERLQRVYALRLALTLQAA